MAQFHGQLPSGGFGIMSSQQVLDWIVDKIGLRTSKKFTSNMQSSLNDIYNDRGKETGGLTYKGLNLMHASSGKAGASDGCTLFWVVRPGGVAKLVAVGQHLNSTTYEIFWRQGDWGYNGRRISL